MEKRLLYCFFDFFEKIWLIYHHQFCYIFKKCGWRLFLCGWGSPSYSNGRSFYQDSCCVSDLQNKGGGCGGGGPPYDTFTKTTVSFHSFPFFLLSTLASSFLSSSSSFLVLFLFFPSLISLLVSLLPYLFSTFRNSQSFPAVLLSLFIFLFRNYFFVAPLYLLSFLFPKYFPLVLLYIFSLPLALLSLLSLALDLISLNLWSGC